MIPKIIHYVWLGGGEPSDTIKMCIESWHKLLPDYEIMRWDELTYNLSQAPRFVTECYHAKKWAFASDYIRLWVLNQYGGIYLDTDVEVRKSLDAFLENRFFIGTQTFFVENNRRQKELKTNLSIGVIGSEPRHPYLEDCLSFYDKVSILQKDGTINTTVSNYKMAELLSAYGYENQDTRQHLKEGIELFPTTYFGDRLSPSFSADCYTYHWGEMSWFIPNKRGILFKFFKSLNLMCIYGLIESVSKKLHIFNR